MLRRWNSSALRGCACLLVALSFAAKLQAEERDIRSPLAPTESQKLIRLEAGLRLELVAAEPQIESPVAMTFDEDGRLWVVEMRDYPNGPPKGEPPQGRIRVLEDRDGDGYFEQSRVFAEGLLFANGLMPWRGGVLVTAAPHVIYLADRDGDGKADHREVLFEGFATENPQLRVNHPILGIDNWVYVANGLRGGKIRRAGRPAAEPINLSGMDFRFDLIHDRYEAISGMGQFGNTFDDWGRRFVCDNHNHLRHVVLPNRYIQRNPYLAAPRVLEDISELGLGPAGSGGKIYPLSKNWTTSNLHAGRFTAACSVHIYGGDLLPQSYRGNAFTCDPTGNLIHREILTPHGATFRSKAAHEGTEFLASPEDWFRPVYLSEGPDGALYVVDMYRAVIEHPEYMPSELKKRPDLTLGKERGRIWRIVSEQHQARREQPRLSKATVAELVRHLADSGAWWRTTAQRLLLERQDRSAVEPLRSICHSAELPQARIHAAWLLQEFGALDDDERLRLLGDRQPRVREQAVVLSEGRLTRSSKLWEKLQALASDADAQVRFQVALTVGELDNAKILPPLADIALAGAEEQWTRLAITTAVPRRAGALVAHLVERGLLRDGSAGKLALLRELASLVGARRDVEEGSRFVALLASLNRGEVFPAQMIALSGLADGMRRRGTRLETFLTSLPASEQDKAEQIDTVLKRSAEIAAGTGRELPERLIAVRLLAHAPWPIASPVLARLMTDDSSQEVRLAAVGSLAAQPRPEVAALLMSAWRNYTPALRREVAEAMLAQKDRTLFFLDELKAQHVKPGDLDPARIRQLLTHRNAEIRDRARQLLQDNSPAERKQVIAAYQTALRIAGDAGRGRVVFEKNCATCHRIGGVGVQVGPDISDTRTKTAEALLTDILNPNQAIDSNYINYQVTTKTGKLLTGIITVETSSSITLQRAENQTDLVLRQDIEEMQSSGLSLMPEGLEKNLTVAEMADLLSFLKNWRYLDGSIPFDEKRQGKLER